MLELRVTVCSPRRSAALTGQSSTTKWMSVLQQDDLAIGAVHVTRSNSSWMGTSTGTLDGCVRIKSSKRIQRARARTFRHGFFCRASRTRGEVTTRPKINQNDFDLAELENFEVLLRRPKPAVDLRAQVYHHVPGPRRRRPALGALGQRCGFRGTRRLECFGISEREG